MSDKTIEQFITELPDGDGWYSDGDGDFYDAAYELLDLGMPEEKIKKMLSRLFVAVSNEYQ